MNGASAGAAQSKRASISTCTECPLQPYETVDDIKANDTFPDAGYSNRFAGLRDKALATIEEGKAVVVGSLSAGVSEMHAWTRCFENYFTDFLLYPDVAEYIMDTVVELKMIIWGEGF